MQYLAATATWRPGFVHPWIRDTFIFTAYNHLYRAIWSCFICFFFSFLFFIRRVCGFLYSGTLPVNILSTSGGQSTTERSTWRRGPTTYHHVGRLYPHQGASLQQNALRGEDVDPQHTTMLGGYNHIKGPVYNRTPYLEKTWTHNIPSCWAAISTSGGQSTTERRTWRRLGPTTYHHVGRLYPERLALKFEKRLSGRSGRLQGAAPRNACERTVFDVHGSIDCRSIEAQ